MIKRGFDVLLALGLMPIAIVICLPMALAIRLESPGNPFFLQKRVGRDKEIFTLWKLRSMKRGVANVGSHEISAAQITRVGHFIRRTKIDELPQVVNVLVGQLSFVGPRPCLPSQLELIEERDAHGVFDIRPGITGPAQLMRIDMSTPRLLAEVDAQYALEQTFWGDLKLVLRTALGGGSGDAVK